MLKGKRLQARQEGRKGSGEVFHSFEHTSGRQTLQMQQKVEDLQQSHRTLANHYLSKIKEMAQVIKRQTEIKEQLTKQVHSLAQQHHQQQNHLAVLAAKAQQIAQENRSQQHLNMVASAYLVPQTATQTEKKSRNGRGTLFGSQKLRIPRALICKSESSHHGDYLLYKSPDNWKRKLKVGGRQIPRAQN